MPVIPTYTNQVSAAPATIPNMPLVSKRANNDAVDDLAALAEAGVRVGAAIEDADSKREALNILSKNTFDSTYLATKNNAPANGDGLTDLIDVAHDQYRDSLLQQTDDPRVQQIISDKMLEEKPRYLKAASVEANAMRNVYDTDQTNLALGSLQNGVMSNPFSYDTNVSLGKDVLANANIPNADKSKMQTAFAQNLAASRFDGMLDRAKTPADVDSIAQDFAQPNWQSDMAPRDYERITKQLEEKKNHLGAKLDAEGEAFLAAVKSRTNEYAPMDDATQGELSAMIRRAPGSKNALQAAQILRDQNFLQANADKSIPELQQTIAVMGQTALQPSQVPPRLVAATNAALAQGNGSVSSGYLLGMAQAEYGQELAKGDAADYGKTSLLGGTATGVGQFTNGTWLGLMKDGRTAARFGIDTTGKSDAELLAMRSSPEVSMQMAMALAEQNKAALQQSLGRDPTDNELYLAHFLGAAGASKFLSAYQVAPYASPKDVVSPDAIAANPGVFDQKNATLKSVYDDISRRSTMSGATIAYNDLHYASGLLAKAQAAAKDGTLLQYTIAMHPGQQVVSPLNPSDGDTFASRGVTVQSIAKQQSVPVSNVKPFLPAEVDAIEQKLSTSNAEGKIQLLSNFARMGDAAPAAFAQLGEKAPVVGYAARLAVLGGQKDVAKDILNGYDRLQNDKTTKTLLGSESGADTVAAFNSAVDNALDGLPPSEVSAIRSAAGAYYVQKNRDDKAFNADHYRDAVTSVLGGFLGKVNGDKTLLPPGVSEADMSSFMNKVGTPDLVNFSVPPTGVLPSAPTDGNGYPVTPYDIAKEGKLIAIGGNKYNVILGDGKPVAMRTGTLPSGLPDMQPFVLKLDRDRVKMVNDRKGAVDTRGMNNPTEGMSNGF